MAVPTNTVSTVSAIGNREDLSDIIYNIAPTDTPLLSMVGHSKASGIFTEWQTDSLEDAATNTAIEGDDATANTFNATVRLGNYCQISRKVVSVSGTQRNVDSAGRADEFSYQLALKGQELKRDMEFAIVRNQASSAGGAGTARATAGLESWLATNKTSAGSGTAQTTPGFASGTVVAPTDSTVAGSFNKADLDAVIQLCWTAGGNPDTIMCGPHNRTQVSGFSGISTLFTDAQAKSDTTLMGAVDFYKSNFGTLKVVPNRRQRDQTVFVLDTEMIGVAMLRDMEVTPLSKTGDSDRSMLLAEYALVSKNELASGKITDCTT